jgi:hypothetical protein
VLVVVMGGDSTGLKVITVIWALIICLPTLACGVRRLHDTGQSGWLCLVGLIPLVGSLVLLVLTALPGEKGPNRYGQDPKEEQTDVLNSASPQSVESSESPTTENVSDLTSAQSVTSPETRAPASFIELPETTASESVGMKAVEEAEQEKSDPSWLIATAAAVLLAVTMFVVIAHLPNQTTSPSPVAGTDHAPSTNTCPSGLPPDVEVGEIFDLSVVHGDDGKLSSSLGDEERWDWAFDFTAINTKKAPGYCITAIEVCRTVPGRHYS